LEFLNIINSHYKLGMQASMLVLHAHDPLDQCFSTYATVRTSVDEKTVRCGQVRMRKTGRCKCILKNPLFVQSPSCFFEKHGIAHNEKSTDSYFDSLNISTEKCIRSYGKPLRNLLSVCSIVASYDVNKRHSTARQS